MTKNISNYFRRKIRFSIYGYGYRTVINDRKIFTEAMMMVVRSLGKASNHVRRQKKWFNSSWSHGMDRLLFLLLMVTLLAALLDRNGLRPSRYTLTKNGFCIMSSEIGVLDVIQKM
jgi:hypothetical protein